MPPLLTFVARLSDGLPLVANTAPDLGQGVTQDHKNQAKDILRGLGGTARYVVMYICVFFPVIHLFCIIICQEYFVFVDFYLSWHPARGPFK
jgi:hypothetical protein